jgi:peptidoglycan-associated lipoprotein
MKNRHSLLPLFLLAITVALPACRNSQTPEEEEDTSGSEDTGSRDASRDVTLTPETTPPTAERCSLSRVYFGFDADELDDASRTAIQQAVECFRTRGLPARLQLTGATDPRGTEEYNIALGDRRAQAVRAYMVSLGIEQARIAVTSVGEEMASGSDESGWARDRSVSASE